MTGTDKLIHRALEIGAEYRAATQTDLAKLERRLRQTPQRQVTTDRRRWLVPAVTAAAAAGLIFVGVIVGARGGAPNSATSLATRISHFDPSRYPTSVPPSAVISAALQLQTVTCTSADRFDNSVTIPVITPTKDSAPGTAMLGYQYFPRAAESLPAQCLLVTEAGRRLTGPTALDIRNVLQYAGRVDGARGAYQFVSATGVAASIRLTRADGTNTTLNANQLTPTPTGFLAAVIYTPEPGPVIAQAAALDSNGRVLNTLHIP